jgi:hypothetical protein
MIKRYFWLLASLMIISPAFSQFLNWQNEDIITDKREVGASPASILDPGGNLHITFWNAGENRLYYGIRERSSGQWTTEMVEDSAGGHVSALVLDAGLNIHVAYLAERNGKAQLRYARRSSGTWAIIERPSADSLLGDYGPDLTVESKVQHSLDIRLAPDGEPIISFFDGSYNGIVRCLGGSSGAGHPDLFLPLEYDFDLNIARRSSAGTWEVNNLDYPLKNRLNSVTCPSIASPDDRFGEFGKLLSYQGGARQLIVTNSFFNHELVVFSSDINNLERWDARVLDSASRIMAAARIWPEDAFGFIDAQITNDTMLHVLCDFSQAYGRKLNTAGGRGNIRDLLYYRIPIASLSDPSLPGLYRHEFVLPPRDGHYRTKCGLAASSNTVVYEAHHDVASEVVVVSGTGDGGQSWIPDTVFRNFETDASLSLNVFSDSLYLLAYDAVREKLELAVRATGSRTWHYEQLTITERRGTSLDAAISPSERIYLTSPEPCSDLLEVAVRDAGNWQIEEATPSGVNGTDLSITAGAGEEAWLAFVQPASGALWLSTRDAGGWQQEQVRQTGRAAAPAIAVNGDSVWIAYTEEVAGSLRLASRSLSGNTWSDREVDNTSNRTGVSPVLRVDSDEALHLAYRDESRKIIRYAKRDASRWSFTDVTSDTTEQIFVSLDMELDPFDGSPHIAYVDDLSATLMYASPLSGGGWQYERAFQSLGSQFGSPLDLVITESGDPWLLFGFNLGGLDIQLIRKAGNAWNQVALNGNTSQIALQFSFLQSGNDLYILGKKNRMGDEGLGMLFAENGATVNLDEFIAEQTVKMFPNPAQDEVNVQWDKLEVRNIQIIDITGKVILSKNISSDTKEARLAISDFPSGLYFLQIKTAEKTLSRKLVLR